MHVRCYIQTLVPPSVRTWLRINHFREVDISSLSSFSDLTIPWVITPAPCYVSMHGWLLKALRQSPQFDDVLHNEDG